MKVKKNMLFAGSIVTTGRARAIVTKTGIETEVGKIADKVANTKVNDEDIPEEWKKVIYKTDGTRKKVVLKPI